MARESSHGQYNYYYHHHETTCINYIKWWSICLMSLIVIWCNQAVPVVCPDSVSSDADTASRNSNRDDKEMNRFHLKRAIKQTIDIMTRGAAHQNQWSYWRSPESDLENIDLNLVKPIEDFSRLNELMEKLRLIQKSGIHYMMLQKDLPKGISPKAFITLTEKLVSPLLTPMSHMFESTMLLMKGKDKSNLSEIQSAAIPQSAISDSKQQLKALQRTDSERKLTMAEMLFVLVDMSADDTSWIWLKDTSTPAERTCDFQHRLLMEQFQLLMERNGLIKNLFIELFKKYVSNSSRKCLSSVCKLIAMDTSVEIVDSTINSKVAVGSINAIVEKSMCELMNMMVKIEEQESTLTKLGKTSSDGNGGGVSGGGSSSSNSNSDNKSGSGNSNEEKNYNYNDNNINNDATCLKPKIEQLRLFRSLATNKPHLIMKLTNKYNKHHLMGIMRLVWACLTLKQTTSRVVKALDWYTTTLCNQLSWCLNARLARLQCPLLDYHYELNQACDMLPSIETNKTIHRDTNEDEEEDKDVDGDGDK